MSSKKLRKIQLQEKQIIQDRKFNKTMLISFSFLFLFIVSILMFYTYWHDTRFLYRKFALYGKEVPGKIICMNNNSLQFHASSEVVYKSKTYYFCSQECLNHLVKHFQEVAFTTDAFSGDTIYKAGALIGLRKRGKPAIVYFENSGNFNNYYAKKRK